MSFVAPPPVANHAHTFPAVANPERLRAPDVQRAVNSNARCVLRSDLLSLNFNSSVTFRRNLNRQFFGPLHTPYLWHGSAVPHLSFVAPPPVANHVSTFPAVANPERLRAPHAQRAVNSNARCVLRSDLLSLNFNSSVTFRRDLNRNSLRPRHTPYLWHGSAVPHLSFVAPPPVANHAHTFAAVANPERLRAPHAQRAANSNARCVLRSDLLSLNFNSSVTFRRDLNRNSLRPRHTPYLSHGSAVRQMSFVAPPPAANYAHTFPAVANPERLRAPKVQRAVNSSTAFISLLYALGMSKLPSTNK
jgi:hypothetical protein